MPLHADVSTESDSRQQVICRVEARVLSTDEAEFRRVQRPAVRSVADVAMSPALISCMPKRMPSIRETCPHHARNTQGCRAWSAVSHRAQQICGILKNRCAGGYAAFKSF